MEARSLSNQQAMEQALGKLVMDGGFRERNALAHIRPGALAAFQRYLDAKRVGDCRRRQAHDVEDPYDTCLTRRES